MSYDLFDLKLSYECFTYIECTERKSLKQAVRDRNVCLRQTSVDGKLHSSRIDRLTSKRRLGRVEPILSAVRRHDVSVADVETLQRLEVVTVGAVKMQNGCHVKLTNKHTFNLPAKTL